VLYLVGGASLLSLLAYLSFAHPDSFLIRGTVGAFAMLCICGIATRWVKVSLHMAFATFTATTLLLVGSRAGWMVLPTVPALAWSRLTLTRHQRLEVVLGSVIGFSSGLVMVLL
jgi:hypothetical protein